MRRALAVLAFFVVLHALFFSPVWIRGLWLASGDATITFIPGFLGERTPWSPYLGAGIPLAAEPEYQAFYPVAWFFRWIGSPNAFVVSAFVLGASFTAGYVLLLTRSLPAALFSGMVYSLGGFWISHLAHVSMLHAAAWTPLWIWSLERLRLARDGRWAGGAAAAVALMVLAGHHQVLIYSLGLGALYALGLGWNAPSGRWWFFRSAILSTAAGVVLSTVQWAPTLELWRESSRTFLSFDGFNQHSLPAAETPRLLFPFFLGGGYARVNGNPAPYLGGASLEETTGYLGMLPLLLSVVGLFSGSLRGPTRFWAAAAAVSLLAALGDRTFLADLLHRVPGYNLFRCPGRHLLVAGLGAACLSGIGFAAALTGTASARVRLFASVGLVGGVAILAAGLTFWPEAWVGPFAAGAARAAVKFSNPGVFAPVALAVASAAAFWALGRPGPSRTAAAAFLGLGAADLFLFGLFCDWRRQARDPADFAFPALLEPYREAGRQKGERVFSFDGAFGYREQAPPSLSHLWRIPNAATYLTLEPRRQAQGASALDPALLVQENCVLDLLGVRFLWVSRERAGRAFGAAPGSGDPRWRVVPAPGPFLAYENLRALPRVRLVATAQVLPPEAILAALRTSRLPGDAEFDPRSTSLLEEPADLGPPGAQFSGEAKILSLQNTRVVLKVRTSTKALLVLADNWHPGWRASVGGRPARILQADYFFRAVEVPAGEHDVEFSYRPLGLRLGLAVTGISVFIGVPFWLAVIVQRGSASIRRGRGEPD